MTSQLVALPTQSRKAFGSEELEKLDEGVGPHRFIRVSLQLWLSRELVFAADAPVRHVPHLAMMLSTAFSHLRPDDEDVNEEVFQQPSVGRTDRNENANPRKVRFMSLSR